MIDYRRAYEELRDMLTLMVNDHDSGYERHGTNEDSWHEARRLLADPPAEAQETKSDTLPKQLKCMFCGKAGPFPSAYISGDKVYHIGVHGKCGPVVRDSQRGEL